MKRKTWFRVLFTAIVVIIGLTAVGWFTWNIGGLFLDLVAKSPVETPQEVKVTVGEILTLPEFDFWTCQIGVFKQKSNADQMVDNALAKGWKAEIIQEDPFVVAVGLFQTKEGASLNSQLMTEQGFEAWVKQESFPELHYRVNGTNTMRVSNILKLSNLLLGGTPRDKVKEGLAGDAGFLFAGECPEDLSGLDNELNKILNNEYEEEPSGYHQDLLKLYLEYKSITTKFSPKS